MRYLRSVREYLVWRLCNKKYTYLGMTPLPYSWDDERKTDLRQNEKPMLSCGQSYKHFKIENYDSRVVI